MSSASNTSHGSQVVTPDALRLGLALLLWSLFAVVLYQVVVHGPLTAVDAPAIAWAASHRDAVWVRLAEWISATGGPSITSAYAGVIVLVALARRRWAHALALAFVIYGAVALNVLVKDTVKRGRPVMEDPLVHLITYSFPSGHAAASTVFGGVLMMLVAARCTGTARRALAVTLVSSWIAAVCATRVYLGVHYPTDVAAGVLEGAGWLLLCRVGLHRCAVWPSSWPRIG